MADRQIYVGIDAGVLHEEGVESYYVGIDAGVFTEDQDTTPPPSGFKPYFALAATSILGGR